jgi:hypothetical protein
MQIFHWRNHHDAKELCLKYPGKINVRHRYLATCLECGDQYSSTRNDKKTCSVTCRQRQRRRLAKLPATKRMF